MKNKNHLDITAVTQHDNLAAEALSKINTIQCHLDETGDSDIAVLALESLTQSVLHMTSVSVARNKATAVYLCELFNANDISVAKGLKDYHKFIDDCGSDSKGGDSPWT